MNAQTPASPQVVNIDNVSYFVQDLTPEVINLMQLMDITNKKLNDLQTEATVQSAAYNEFGNKLREGLKNIKPINAGIPEVIESE